MKKTILRILSLTLIVVTLMSIFIACDSSKSSSKKKDAKPNKDPIKAQEALEDEGYIVYSGNDLVLDEYGEGVQTVISAFKYNEDDDYDAVVIIYYEDTDYAKDAEEEYLDKWKAEAEDDLENIIAKRSGSMIYMGTKQAIKDAK